MASNNLTAIDVQISHPNRTTLDRAVESRKMSGLQFLRTASRAQDSV